MTVDRQQDLGRHGQSIEQKMAGLPRQGDQTKPIDPNNPTNRWQAMVAETFRGGEPIIVKNFAEPSAEVIDH